MTAPRTYKRPMTNWWKRLPFYRRYLLREATCFAVIAYALVLLTGLWRFTQGEAAYTAWRASLASPLAVALHLAVLAAMVFHAWTWFEVMPKTMPFVRIGGRRVADGSIVGAGAAAGVAGAVIVLVLSFWGLR